MKKSILTMLALAVITMPFLSCDDDYLPGTATNGIKVFIEEKYPDARILEIERDDNRTIEADVLHDNVSKEVVFDLNNNWLRTSWDMRISDLPQEVRNIINDPAYTGYHIDDADFVETPQGNYYLLELEKGNSEVKVKIDGTGKVLN
ncbi:PepSY-like domain-containing protein [uncultured Proteiniphilum sp.]|uniref:PepSY-like domain-containing protein n=1 Tax=uncultured Proteiniphilum sp. TaxID=497637 RepID=UPI00260A6B97|nr:PepSY-like domain-containing protein [uncultured Proteiniphilum sp.]